MKRERRSVSGQTRELSLDYGTAAELAGALAAGTISALELTDHVIARIEALDPKLNAVVVRDFERARESARKADAALARGERRPLLGVPLVIKESFDVAGLPTTWGVPAFKDFKPAEDAVVVRRMKQAGAILLGKTNVPLLLGDWQSYNDVYGSTNNPWDLGRTPGGSSGGSSAALAAGFGPLSLGSDIGGSLRVPAHFCGVCAHKPTLGLVPLRGHGVPHSFARENGLSVVGPMARSVADLELTLDLIAGPDESQAGTAYRLALPDARHRDLKDFRAIILDEHPLMPAAADMRAAIDTFARRLVKAGVKVSRDARLVPDLAQAGRLYVKLLWAALSERWPQDVYDRANAAAKALDPADDSLTAERMRGPAMSHRDWAAADIARIKIQQQWSALFRDWDVVIFPPMATPAYPHDHSPSPGARKYDIDGKDYPYLDQMIWAAIATLPGLPATAVPVALSPKGLPIGAQIVGPYLEDRTPLAFASLMEREFGGFVPPPGYA